VDSRSASYSLVAIRLAGEISSLTQASAIGYAAYKMPSMRILAARLCAVASASAALSLAVPARAQTILDSCGQTVGGDVVLAADLDCSGASEPWVTFEASGILSLGGHTFSGTVRAPVQGLKVVGPGTVTGPGDGIYAQGDTLHGPHVVVSDGAEIAGNEGIGVYVDAIPGNRPSVMVIGASISDNGSNGIVVSTHSACPALNCIPPGKIRVREAVLSGNGGYALSASNVAIQSATITGNGAGVNMQFEYIGRKLGIKDSTIDDNVGAGITMQAGAKAKLKVVRSSVSRNATGILDNTYGERSTVTLRDAVLDANGYGHRAAPRAAADVHGRLNLVRSQVSRSTFSGISTPPDVMVKLNATSVLDSGADPQCGISVECFDLDTGVPPRLSPTAACGTSHVFDSGLPGQTWSLCSAD